MVERGCCFNVETVPVHCSFRAGLEAFLEGVFVKRWFRADLFIHGVCICYNCKEPHLPGKIAFLTKSFESEMRITSNSTTQTEAPWDLTRLATIGNATDFGVRRTGKGVNVYVLDSGIDYNDKELAGRVYVDKTYYSDDRDVAKHGTKVASLAAGTNTGVAKLSNIHAIRVLDDHGEGSASDLIDALYWILRNAKRPAVVNLSVGGCQSAILQKAVRDLYNAGILTVVSAGNDSANACDTGCVTNGDALIVGATTRENTIADFSNWGGCVDLFAPGLHNIATVPYSDRYSEFSGTSAAAPLVSGIAALLLESDPTLNAQELRQRILEATASGSLHGAKVAESTNRLAQIPNNIGDTEAQLNYQRTKTEDGDGTAIALAISLGVCGALALTAATLLLIKCCRRPRRQREA